MLSVGPLIDGHRELINKSIRENWAGPFIVTRGRLHDTREDKGFVASDGGDVAGYLLYDVSNGDLEITVLESLRERIGAGSALLRAAVDTAKAAGCRRVWLITTNDNTRAIRFYQKFGFSLRAVHINSMNEARRLKPRIPLEGIDGIPILHEFEFEIML